jgi:hypothetical protein
MAVIAGFAQNTTIADYNARLAAYMKVHAAAASHMAAHTPTTKGTALAEAIRARRPDAVQGDIFTPAIAQEFRRVALISLKNHPAEIRTSIRSGEIVPPAVRVNGSYPTGFPVETMPPSLLAALPALPEPLKYRLMSHALVLLDAEDKLVVDFIPSFLPEQ